MKKQIQRLLLLVVAILSVIPSAGKVNIGSKTVKVGGIYYYIYGTSHPGAAEVSNSPGTQAENKNSYIGDVVIPSSFSYNGSNYRVVGIGDNAFVYCDKLKSVTIPSSVYKIAEGVFAGCDSLASINVSTENSNYSSADGILYDEEKTTLICCPSGKTGSLIVPSSVTSLGDRAFYGCSGLTSITIPSSVTSIGAYAFAYCNGLDSITIPSSVIGRFAFSNCENLSSVTILSSVTSIGECVFDHCRLSSLYLLAKGLATSYSSCFSQVRYISGIYAYQSEINAIKSIWKGKGSTIFRDIELPYHLSESRLYGSVVFSVDANKYVPATLKNIKFKDTEVFPDEKNRYTITNLAPDTPYDIIVTYKTADGDEKSYFQTIRTAKPGIGAYYNSCTQTTMTLSVNASSDATYSAGRKGIYYNGEVYYCTGDNVVLRDLTPNSHYSIIPFADYGTTRITGNSISYATASLNPTVTALNVSPTSISIKGGYTVDDAHVSETGFTDHGTGNTLTLTGLTPNTYYIVNYYVKTKEGSNETVSQTFTTSPTLKLTTLQPRGVSSTCSIVAAETNMSDDEINAGFQWKKYDAPESLKPSEGYAAIYNGQLEGYIRNLQPTSYYNVRAFYKSADGKYYYGDWVTFDPSDFSYFEPTVHTYAATDVTHSSVRVKGYVLAGTDAIDEQGFEYWPTEAGRTNALRVKAALTDDADGVQTVLATGQVMTAELRDLLPETTYCCRAFVRTATGTTYGEEQTFKTEADPTGIGHVVAGEKAAPTVTGYYDMSGRKSATPHHGVNIVRYSDGTTRKVIMK